jgi:predicted metal-dependent phosphoesterase TrpH
VYFWFPGDRVRRRSHSPHHRCKARNSLTQVWSKADLHTHSATSDGAHDVRTMLAHVADKTDLKIIAVTDHDAIDGALRAEQIAPRYGLQVVVGEEVSTTRGHLLALFIHKHIPAGLSLPETVTRVHAQGGLAIQAHALDPFANSPMRRWPWPTLADWRSFDLDGLEILNASQIDPLAHRRGATLGHVLQVAMTGGSDAHHKDAIGTAFTLFPGATVADLRYAIQQRLCVAAGRRWHLAEYANWVAFSYAPRQFPFLAHLRQQPFPTAVRP